MVAPNLDARPESFSVITGGASDAGGGESKRDAREDTTEGLSGTSESSSEEARPRTFRDMMYESR